MSSDVDPQQPQQPSGPDGQPDPHLAKILAANFDGEEDLDSQASLLQLPESLSADPGEGDEADETSAAPTPADPDSADEAVADQQADESAEQPPSAADLAEAFASAGDESVSAGDVPLAEGDDEGSISAGWVSDGDQRPLLQDDDQAADDAALRGQIQSNIAGLAGLDESDQAVPEVLDLPPSEIRAAVEALLLISAKPMTVTRLASCLPGSNEAYLGGLLAGLSERYRHEYRGWDLRQLAGGWQLLTRPALHPWVRQLDKQELPSRLSKSAMETLAIVAYKQPVTRGDIEDIRGVQCGPMLRQLMDLKLVQVVGRNDDAVGRPLLYGTTTMFLDRFGLGSLADLPRQHEFGG